MNAYQPHLAQYKVDEVKSIKKLCEEYPVIGILNLEGLPADQYQKLRHSIKDIATIKFARKDFMQIALKEVKKQNIEQLQEKLVGVPALLFTKEDPFKLYKRLEKSKSAAAAKPGQKAPNDITLPAGPTPFTPGPMIGELGQLGIKTEVKEGKIHVKLDKLLVKEGEEINAKIAALLAKLSIEPMKIGLNLLLTYNNGEILTKDVLFVDEEAYIKKVKEAHSDAFKLAYSVAYPIKEVLEALIKQAEREAEAIAKHVPESTATASVVESKEAITTEQMEQTEKVVKAMQARTVSLKSTGEKHAVNTEQDMNKIINDLKDKKSRGELS